MSPPHTAKIQCIAILSPRNAPIYLRQFQHQAQGPPPSQSAATTTPSSSTLGHGPASGADLRYHYFAHAALDVIEERTASSSKNAEQYLGLLYTLEDLAVYGFTTSTRVKFLLMISLTDHVVRDIDLLTLFRAIHTAYLSYASNPFHSLPPRPSFRLHQTATTPSSPGTAPEQQQQQHQEEEARASLLAMRDSSLPLKARQIRSSGFESAIERIVGIQPVATAEPGRERPAAPQLPPRQGVKASVG